MDTSALRWTLVIIGMVLLIGIYLHGLYQNRLRKRTAMETFSHETVDSAFIEDQESPQLSNLSQIMTESDEQDTVANIKINPPVEADLTPFKQSSPDWFIADIVSSLDADQMVNHWIYHANFQPMTREEVESAIRLVGLESNKNGYMEYHHEDQLSFTMVNLSAPGHFLDIDKPEFCTQGFNCFIDLQTNRNPALGYEIMLKKIDELVSLLNVTVYQPNHDWLTISDVTQIRKKLST